MLPPQGHPCSEASEHHPLLCWGWEGGLIPTGSAHPPSPNLGSWKGVEVAAEGHHPCPGGVR